MLPRLYRLPATVRLQKTFTYVTPLFLVKVAKNEETNSRFGFIIGKAVSKSAVERNRARRLLRSCIEERLTEIEDGHDMLFLLKRGIIDVERETLDREIQRFLEVKHMLKSQ